MPANLDNVYPKQTTLGLCDDNEQSNLRCYYHNEYNIANVSHYSHLTYSFSFGLPIVLLYSMQHATFARHNPTKHISSLS